MHQADTIDKSQEQDNLFRKGVDSQAYLACHSFRPKATGNRIKSMAPFRTPKTPDKTADKVRVSAEGLTFVGKMYKKSVGTERKKDLIHQVQALGMKYTNLRDEQLRAQNEIDRNKVTHDTFNAKLMANPNFREVRKQQWVDKKHPFNVRKADTNIICDRQVQKSTM